MRRDPDRSVTAVAAARPRISRPLMLTAAFLALALAVFVFARTAAPRHAAAPKASPVVVASTDAASAPWFLAAPTAQKIGKATNRPAKTKAAAPEPDWSAFSLGVSDAQAAVVAPKSNDASSPAELVVAMSRQERSRLMNAAHDADNGTAPAGYRPAIGQLYPAGGGDGICS
jgi:hypothetical protein